MGLSKKNKNSPPAELPDLAIDELKKDLKNAIEGKEEIKTEEKPVETPKVEEKIIQDQIKEIVVDTNSKEETKEIEQINVNENQNKEKSIEKIDETSVKSYKLDPKKSFFNALLVDLEKKETDIAKLNEWYNTRFPQGNALEEMKEYWKEKKDEIILENIGKELKDKIDLHMKQLQKLEEEWQKIYFDLISKEDEMKNQEKRLKEVINEFTEVFKKRGNIKKDRKEKIINEKKEKKA